MADAKVIPFDDDRSRSSGGGGSRAARRRTGTGPHTGPASGRAEGTTAPVSALPGAQVPGQGYGGTEPPQGRRSRTRPRTHRGTPGAVTGSGGSRAVWPSCGGASPAITRWTSSATTRS